MPAYIAILDDGADRPSAMREVAAAHRPADEMIVWLQVYLDQVALISLDHDLPLVQVRDGVRVDAGTGRIVADWLAERPPRCPVVVHTSNEQFAPGMMRVLRDGGWVHRRVYPHADCAWVADAWAEALTRYLPAAPVPPAPVGF